MDGLVQSNQSLFFNGRSKSTGTWRRSDQARRGAAAGLEIAGAFIKPMASKKAAWVLGQAPQFEFEDDATQRAINDWFHEHHTDVLLAMEEAAVMADYFMVVNPDESVTVVPPNVVEPLVDEQDYARQVGWRITRVYAHPQKPWLTQTIIDDYTTSKRTRTVFRSNGQKTVSSYRNLSGLIPVIHIANNLRGGELFGHPEAEALVQAFHHYNEVLDAAIVGNIRQGRPTPVFKKLGSSDNLQQFIEAFGQKKTRSLPDGTSETYTEIVFSSDLVVYLGETGEFEYAQPGSFTADTMNITQLLFYIIIQHSEQPEFIWGNAIAGSRASAETQLPPFVRWAEKEQGRAEKWLIPLVQYIRALKSTYEPDVKYDPDEKPKVKWAPLSDKDGQLTLEALKVALTLGGWEPEDVVPYMPLDIDNPEEIIQKLLKKKADEERRMNGEDEPFVPPANHSPAGEKPAGNTANESLMEALVSEQHRGVMLGFEIDLDSATSLASAARQAGIEPVAPEDMHLTLAYCGDMSAYSTEQRSALEGTLSEALARISPLAGSIAGIGRFNASQTSDGKDVLYASFDAPDLPDFRQRLVSILENAGLQVSREHGFTPHITLAYVDRDDAMPDLMLDTLALRFEKVTLYWGDERKQFSLQGETAQEAVPA